GGVHQVDGGNVVVNGDVLRPNDLLGGHREEGAGFHRGIVHDEHEQAAVDAAQAGNHAGSRSAAPFFVHAVSSVDAQFEQFRAGIEQPGDALAGGEAAFLVLRFDGLGAATLGDLFFFVAQAGNQFGHGPHVLLEALRGGVNGGEEQVVGGFGGGLGTVGHG